MTAELPPELAAAYIRELSVAVRAVVAAPEELPDGVYVVPEGIVLVAARTAVLMDAGALWSPTALDLAAVTGAPPPEPIANPRPEAVSEARRLLRDAG